MAKLQELIRVEDLTTCDATAQMIDQSPEGWVEFILRPGQQHEAMSDRFRVAC